VAAAAHSELEGGWLPESTLLTSGEVDRPVAGLKTSTHARSPHP